MLEKGLLAMITVSCRLSFTIKVYRNIILLLLLLLLTNKPDISIIMLTLYWKQLATDELFEKLSANNYLLHDYACAGINSSPTLQLALSRSNKSTLHVMMLHLSGLEGGYVTLFNKFSPLTRVQSCHVSILPVYFAWVCCEYEHAQANVLNIFYQQTSLWHN